jgi:alpha-tubulin suppressor-like RCC1 family protein
MAVSNTNSTISYTGTNTGNQSCPIPFLWYEETDIVVTLIPASGTAQTLVLNTDYILLGTGNPAGGSAMLFTPVPTTTTINLSRNVPATQLTSFVTGDRFPASVVERALDKATMLVQQFLRASNRTLRFGAASPEQPELAPVPASGQYVLGVSEGNLGWQTPPEVVLADGAVTNAKIADGAITSAKIAAGVSLVPDGSITNQKLAPNSVTSANIAPGTIVETDVADDSVTDAKLSSTGATAGIYPPSSIINGIPRFTINAKGRISSATSVPMLPAVRPVRFAESNFGEVGYRNWNLATIFLDSNGNLRMAGANATGRFGIGIDSISTGGSGFLTIPWTPVSSSETISKFWVTESNLYVLSSAGRVYACGSNAVGQLGVNMAAGGYIGYLTHISTLSNVVDFAVSPSSSTANCHCFAVTSSGQLWGWGNNEAGQLGRGNITSPVLQPIQITQNGIGSRQIKKAYAWGHAILAFSYIIDSEDNVFSCGYNGWGQLGLGDLVLRNTFVQVPTLKADAIFGAGSPETTYGNGLVFIVRNGNVWGTGLNVRGSLGYGDTTTKNGFVQLSISNVVSISLSNPFYDAGSSVCALLNDGTIRVWGFGGHGIGLPNQDAYLTPQTIPTLSGLQVVKTQFIGSWYTGVNFFVLTSDGRLWVSGYRGRLFGRNVVTNAEQFTLVPAFDFGSSNIRVAFDDFRVYGTGSSVTEGAGILAKTATGELYAWGRNQEWALGLPQANWVNIPQRVYL